MTLSEFIGPTHPVEILGYISLSLVFAGIQLNKSTEFLYLSICCNLIFLIFGYLQGLYPLLMLHAGFLPINAIMLLRVRRQIELFKEAIEKDDHNLDWLFPHMTHTNLPAGHQIFQKGDDANEMYYLVSGQIRLTEIDIELGPGTVMGEIGLFAPEQKRTATAETITDVELLAITKDRAVDLFYRNRIFGIYIMKLITARLLENIRRLELKQNS